MDIGGKIYQLRKENELTQEQLAAEMGVSITAVSKWENNVSNPDLLILCALADYFQVTTDYLLCRRGLAIKTLIADPSDFLRSVLKPILINNGCNVIKDTGDYKNLMQTLDQFAPFQLLTYEIGQNAEEGLKRLRDIKETYPDIYIVVISNQHEQEIIDQAMPIGIFGYIKKPFREEHVTPFLKLIAEKM